MEVLQYFSVKVTPCFQRVHWECCLDQKNLTSTKTLRVVPKQRYWFSANGQSLLSYFYLDEITLTNSGLNDCDNHFNKSITFLSKAPMTCSCVFTSTNDLCSPRYHQFPLCGGPDYSSSMVYEYNREE